MLNPHSHSAPWVLRAVLALKTALGTPLPSEGTISPLLSIFDALTMTPNPKPVSHLS